MREVILKFSAFKEMIHFLSKYSSNNIPVDGWAESLGYLFCIFEDDYYIIEGAVGIGSGTEYSVHPSPMENANYDIWRNRYGCDIGGWWHTHPGLDLFFSEWDVKNHVGWQEKNPEYLGVVFDHTLVSTEFLGFKIFRMLHAFSDDVIEVEYHLQGFTKEGIRETLGIIGIEENIIGALAEKYGGKGLAPRINFSKIGEPIVDEPLGDAEWIVMEAEELMEEEKIIEAIKKYKMAEIILNGTEHLDAYTDILSTLIQLCVENNFIENAKEEFSLFEAVKEKIDPGKYREIHEKLSQLLKDK